MAAVVASVPEEQKRIFSTQGIRSRTSSASWISRGEGAPKEEPSFMRVLHLAHHLGVAVADDERAPGEHVVDVVVAVDVERGGCPCRGR